MPRTQFFFACVNKKKVHGCFLGWVGLGTISRAWKLRSLRQEVDYRPCCLSYFLGERGRLFLLTALSIIYLFTQGFFPFTFKLQKKEKRGLVWTDGLVVHRTHLVFFNYEGNIRIKIYIRCIFFFFFLHFQKIADNESADFPPLQSTDWPGKMKPIWLHAPQIGTSVRINFSRK